MKPTRAPSLSPRRRWAVCAAAWLATVAAGTATAAPADDARARFEKERARCFSGQSSQDQATCLREARAAYAEARRGRLDNGQQALYDRNATARCERLPAADRNDCLRRMKGEGTVSGSVEGGGIYREMVTVTVGTPGEGASASGTSAAPGSAPGAAPAPAAGGSAPGALHGPSGMAPSTSTPVAPVNTPGTSPGSATAPMPPAQPPVQPSQ